MSIKPDHWIRRMALEEGMIAPFEERLVRDGVISYGLSSYGYDIRVADTYLIPEHRYGQDVSVIDVKEPQHIFFREYRGNVCVIPPNSFVLAHSMERFKIPRRVLSICLGKSTYARAGIIVNVTPLEPEWSGILTIEISNTTPLPAKIYSNEGIAQLIFFESDSMCEISYADRKGKYQDQTTVTPPRL